MTEKANYVGVCPRCGNSITEIQTVGLTCLDIGCPTCGAPMKLWEEAADHNDGATDYSGV